MRLPVISGIIRRRLLVNFRVEPEVMQAQLPPEFRPKLHRGRAIAGICLIRLEGIRPRGLPAWLGISSENAAHRVAVEWDGPDGAVREGVYILRRDTGSRLNALAGGRVFPGEHHFADFAVTDADGRIVMDIRSRDGAMRVALNARETDMLPADSCFASLAESSDFFARGSVGYSVTGDCCRLDGIRLQTQAWSVRPLAVESVSSSWLDDTARFPAGTARFDHALLMRDLPHEWHGEPDFRLGS